MGTRHVSKRTFDDLRTRNPGKTNLDNLLGISPKLPEDITDTKDERGNNLNHQNKKQKVQHFNNQQKKGGQARASRGGRKNNKGKNNGHQQSPPK